jgi:four helix bundle protein
MDIAEAIYRVTREFPKHELYGLGGQMQRAAVSVPSNIAEGHARESTKEFLRHLSIAMGSRAEMETQLILSHRLDYCPAIEQTILGTKINDLGKMIGGLQRSLKSKL